MVSSLVVRLYLVRHAEPAYPEDALTPLGHRQAAALARRFAALGLDRVVSSPMRRARETAAPTAAGLGLAVEIEPWARELEDWWIPGGPHGEQPVWQVERERLLALAADRPWYEQPPFDRAAFGERHRALIAAADAFVSRLRAAAGAPARVAVFCHEGLALTWLAHLLSLHPLSIWAGFRLPAASLTTVELPAEGEGDDAIRCVGLGDVGHLAGAAGGAGP